MATMHDALILFFEHRHKIRYLYPSIYSNIVHAFVRDYGEVVSSDVPNRYIQFVEECIDKYGNEPMKKLNAVYDLIAEHETELAALEYHCFMEDRPRVVLEYVTEKLGKCIDNCTISRYSQDQCDRYAQNFAIWIHERLREYQAQQVVVQQRKEAHQILHQIDDWSLDDKAFWHRRIDNEGMLGLQNTLNRLHSKMEHIKRNEFKLTEYLEY